MGRVLSRISSQNVFWFSWVFGFLGGPSMCAARPIKYPLAGIFLLKSEFDAFGLFGLPSFADDSLKTALALRNWLAEAELGLLKRHHTTLKNFAVETTNDVFVRLALIFSSKFNSHIVFN